MLRCQTPFRQSVAEEAARSIKPAELAALLDLGLSDERITAYLSLSTTDLQTLRDRSGKSLDPAWAARCPPARETDAELLARHLQELAERLWAACNFAAVLRYQLRDVDIGRALRSSSLLAQQIEMASEEFHRIRRRLAGD